jgi:hypothetical protein
MQPVQSPALTEQQIAMAWLAISDPIDLGSKFHTSESVKQFAHALWAIKGAKP